jgi:hypothetical protein
LTDRIRASGATPKNAVVLVAAVDGLIFTAGLQQ